MSVADDYFSDTKQLLEIGLITAEDSSGGVGLLDTWICLLPNNESSRLRYKQVYILCILLFQSHPLTHLWDSFSPAYIDAADGAKPRLQQDGIPV